MRRVLRWVKRIVLGVLALVLVAVVALLIIVHTDWGRDRIRRLAEAQLAAVFPGGFTIERIDGSVLGDLEIRGVAINALDGAPMIRVGKLRTNVALSALFTKTIRLEYVEVSDLTITNPSNPAKLSDEPPEEGGWDLELPQIAVRGVRVTVDGDPPLTLTDVSIDAALAIPGVGPVVAAAFVKGTWAERALPFAVTARAAVGERVEISHLTVAAGDAGVLATGVVIDGERSTGTILAHATPAMVARFAPTVQLPADGNVTVILSHATATESRADLLAAVGTATVWGTFVGDPQLQTARGMLVANHIDLAGLAPDLSGRGDGVIAATLADKHLHATAFVRGQLLDLPPGHAVVGLDATLERAQAILVAGGSGNIGTAAFGQLARAGDKIDLVNAHVVMTARDVAKPTGGRVPFAGAIAVHGRAHGALAPELALAVEGSLTGRSLRSTDPELGGIRIPVVDGTIGATISKTVRLGQITATARQVSRGGTPLGTFSIDAHNQRDGRLAATLVARPAAAPVRVEIAALVTLPVLAADPIEVAIASHSVTGRGVDWRGRGGSLVIADDQLRLTGLKSRGGDAVVDLDATYRTQTGAVQATAHVERFALSTLDATLGGMVSVEVDMSRRGRRWDGAIKVHGGGIVLGPDRPPLDAELVVTVANRRVTADATVTTFQLGGVRLVLDLEGPRDLTDGPAWRRLDRAAIRTALLGLSRIDLAAAKVPTGGILDGEIVIAGLDASGTFTARGLETNLGRVDADVNLAPIGSEVGVSSTVKVARFGEAEIAATIVVPDHPFEPAEWRRLGRGVVRLLTANIEDVVVDPVRLGELGIAAPYSGKANVELALAAGAGQARATIDLREISGGALRRPIDVRIEASTSTQDTHASVGVRVAKQDDWSDADKRLVKLTGEMPSFTFDRWLADAKSAATAPFTGRFEIPEVDVAYVLALVGRTDVVAGTLGGAIDFSGTVGTPIAKGELAAHGVKIKPRLTGRKLPTLDELKLAGKWGGAAGEVKMTGRQSDGGTLEITARGSPSYPEAVFARADIKKFDLAPIAAFLPGAAGAATGRVNADVTMTGLAFEKVRGKFSLEKGRFPIAPQVGTVRDTNLSITLAESGLDLKLAAKLGAGTIELTAKAGADLATIVLGGTVDKISPIGEIQPVISAKIAGSLSRDRWGAWRGDARVSDANVTITMDESAELLDAEIPDDLYIGVKPPPVTKQERVPRKPWFTIRMKLDSTPLFVKHEFFQVRARFGSPKGITLSIGRTLGIDGSIEIERGDVDVLGRNYRLEPGKDRVRFDGTADPLLDLKLVHVFPELTLTVDVSGRARKREIHMSGAPSSSNYSEDELFAIFAGGDPSGDRSTQARDAAASAGAAFLSAKLGRQARKILPFKVDVIGCDPGSSATGASCRAGRWLTENWFVAFKHRIEPRQDELPEEIQAQYYFRKNWLFEASGWADRVGGDVLWRKRW